MKWRQQEIVDRRNEERGWVRRVKRLEREVLKNLEQGQGEEEEKDKRNG